jgi:SAM-dependent methyltransferase
VTDSEFIAALYRLLLRREVDDEGAAQAASGLKDGTLSRASLAAALMESAEFAAVRRLDDAIATARRGPLHDLHAEAGTTERDIEIPWVLSRIHGATSLLDVGYANAPPAYLDALTGAGVPRVVGVDLVRADVPGLESVVGDLRRLPFGDDTFDVVTCVSTIEHVGLDNSVYGITDRRDTNGMVAAAQEMARVTVPGGRVLITTPVGIAEDHGWFVQQPAQAWLELFGAAGLRPVEHETYELGPAGWGHVTGEPPVRYGERGPAASAVLCAALSTST